MLAKEKWTGEYNVEQLSLVRDKVQVKPTANSSAKLMRAV